MVVGVGVLVVLAFCIASVVKSQDSFVQRRQQWKEWFKSVEIDGTIIVITIQIIASMSTSHRFQGGSGYPEPLKQVTDYFEMLTFDVFKVSTYSFVH